MLVEDLIRLMDDTSYVIIDTNNGDNTFTILYSGIAQALPNCYVFMEVIMISVMGEALTITI